MCNLKELFNKIKRKTKSSYELIDQKRKTKNEIWNLVDDLEIKLIDEKLMFMKSLAESNYCEIEKFYEKRKEVIDFINNYTKKEKIIDTGDDLKNLDISILAVDIFNGDIENARYSRFGKIFEGSEIFIKRSKFIDEIEYKKFKIEFGVDTTIPSPNNYEYLRELAGKWYSHYTELPDMKAIFSINSFRYSKEPVCKVLQRIPINKDRIIFVFAFIKKGTKIIDQERSEMVGSLLDFVVSMKKKDMEMQEHLDNLLTQNEQKPKNTEEYYDIKSQLSRSIEIFQKIYDETDNLWKDLYNFREKESVFKNKDLRNLVEQAYKDSRTVNLSIEKIIKYLKGE